MNRPGNTLIPAVIVILAIAATIGVYAFSVWPTDQELNVNTVQVTQPKNTNRTGATNVNTSITTNTNTTTVDAAKDWKTYNNTTIGYIVKYPPPWKASTCESSTAVSFGLQGLKCDSDAPTEDFIVAEIIDNVSVSSRVASIKGVMISPVESKVTVAGLSGTRITGVHKKDSNAFYGGGQYSDDIFVAKNGRTYRLGYAILGGEKKYTSEFEEFYKTFTFTNVTADATKDWKTYTNTEWKYSFQYPPESSIDIRDNGRTFRIQNYFATTDNYRLESGKFYLEGGASDPRNQPSGSAFEPCTSTVSDPRTVSFGTRKGLLGGWENGGGDAGGFRTVMACISDPDLYFSAGVTEGSKTSIIGKQILDSLVFTK